MKRIFKGVLLFICLCICTTAAYASGSKELEVYDGLDMKISIPTELVAFTRDIDPDDPNLSAYGLTGEGLLALMEDSSIYLDAWDADYTYEIVVTVLDSPVDSYQKLSDVSLQAVALAVKAEYEQMGITLLDSQIYQNDQMKYLQFWISQPQGDSTMYSLQYNTVYEGKVINITLHALQGEIGAMQESLILDVVESVSFGESEAPVQTEAFSYVEPVSGVQLTVPANWFIQTVGDDVEYVDALFESSLEEGLRIAFTFEDVYTSETFLNELTEAEKQQMSRADINNSILTKQDVADIFDISADVVEMATYGGKEYYRAQMEATPLADDATVTVPVTALIRYENGYMYLFQFSGDRDNAYYGDFESLVSSAVYPAVQLEPEQTDGPADGQETAEPQTPEETEDDAGPEWTGSRILFFIVNLFLSLLITIVVYSLPIFFYRFAIRRAPVEKKKAKKITLIYGACALVVMIFIVAAINKGGTVGGAIVLWSWVNYRMLISGQKQEPVPGSYPNSTQAAADTQAAPGTQTAASVAAPAGQNADGEPSVPVPGKATGAPIAFCPQCGSPVEAGSTYCGQCGTRLPVQESK